MHVVAYPYFANALLISHAVHTSNSTLCIATTSRYDLLNRLTGKESITRLHLPADC